MNKKILAISLIFLLITTMAFAKSRYGSRSSSRSKSSSHSYSSSRSSSFKSLSSYRSSTPSRSYTSSYSSSSSKSYSSPSSSSSGSKNSGFSWFGQSNKKSYNTSSGYTSSTKNSSYSSSSNSGNNNYGRNNHYNSYRTNVDNNIARTLQSQQSRTVYNNYKTKWYNNNRNTYFDNNWYRTNNVYLNFHSRPHYYRNMDDYYRYRTNYYYNLNYNPPQYYYSSYRNFGVWDSLFLWMMLDKANDVNYTRFYASHYNDPGMVAWRNEAMKMSAQNNELRQKLEYLEGERANYASQNGANLDPNYIPQGLSEDVMLAPDVVQNSLSSQPAPQGSNNFNQGNYGNGNGYGNNSYPPRPVKNNSNLPLILFGIAAVVLGVIFIPRMFNNRRY